MKETKILRLNNEGEGIGIIDDITTFIPYALPNEIVTVKVDNIYDNYATGTLKEIIAFFMFSFEIPSIFATIIEHITF